MPARRPHEPIVLSANTPALDDRLRAPDGAKRPAFTPFDIRPRLAEAT